MSSSLAKAGDESNGLIVSVELIGCLSNGGADNLAVDGLEVGHSLDDLWRVLLPVDLAAVDRITNQKKRLDFWKLRELGDLVPRSDPIITNEQRV